MDLAKVLLIFTHMNPKKPDSDSNFTPKRNDRSPLDVPAVPTNITKEEIISTIRQIRERG